MDRQGIGRSGVFSIKNEFSFFTNALEVNVLSLQVGKIPQWHFSVETTALEKWSLVQVDVNAPKVSCSQLASSYSQAYSRYVPQDDHPVRNKIAATDSVINPRCTLRMLMKKHTHKMPHP